jgi:hypothetical protein
MKIYVKATTNSDTLLTNCLKRYFPQLSGDYNILSAIRRGFIQWRGSDDVKGFLYPNTVFPCDFNPDTIVIASPEVYRKFDRKTAAQDAILSYMLSSDFCITKTLSYIFKNVISPLVSDFLNNNYTDEEMQEMTYTALCNSGICELTNKEVDAIVKIVLEQLNQY